MAYTPPTGNSVDFAFTGAAYTPPAGVIEFAWSGFFAATVSGAVQFAAEGQGAHGVVGSFAETGITLQADASGIVAPLASCRVFLPLSASATGEFPFLGPATFSGLLSGAATGVVPMTATVAGAVTFRATAVGGGADITGAAETSLTLEGSATGQYWTPYAAGVAARFGFAAQGAGLFAAMGAARPSVRLSGAASGRCGVVGTGSAVRFIGAHVTARRGVIGAAHGAFAVTASASAARGNAASVSKELRFVSAASGRHYAPAIALSEASLPFSCRAVGQTGRQKAPSPSLSILTATDALSVVTPHVHP